MNSQPTVGPYQLLEELGRGKRTIVYKAWQSSVGRPVALKTLRRHDPNALEKFQAEARLSANLKSPGVRDIYEAGETPDGCIYVAMEYVERSLKDLLQGRLDRGEAFSREQVGYLLTPIAKALDDIHSAGLVHLDIKPANILVSKEGYAVLADFGISRRRGEQTHEGTPLYMSPEQAAGNRPVGPWSDIYSLGALIYEMMTGLPPFLGDMDLVLVRQHLQDEPPSPRQFNPRLDRDVERTLLAALSKDPRQRPPTASALLRRVSVRHPAPISKASNAIRGRPIIPITIAILLIVLIPALFLASGLVPGGSDPTTTSSPTATTIVTSSTPVPPTITAEATDTHTPRPGASRTPTPIPSKPTSTPITLTPTATYRPASPAPAATPMSLTPKNGAEVKGTMVTFIWHGELRNNEHFIVALRHPESGTALKSEKLTTKFWSTTLPADKFGRWDWQVHIVRRDEAVAQGDIWHFYLDPHGG